MLRVKFISKNIKCVVLRIPLGKSGNKYIDGNKIMSMISYIYDGNPWQVPQIREESPLMVLGIDVSELKELSGERVFSVTLCFSWNIY